MPFRFNFWIPLNMLRQPHKLRQPDNLFWKFLGTKADGKNAKIDKRNLCDFWGHLNGQLFQIIGSQTPGNYYASFCLMRSRSYFLKVQQTPSSMISGLLILEGSWFIDLNMPPAKPNMEIIGNHKKLLENIGNYRKF